MQGLIFHRVTSLKSWEGLSQCDNENANKRKYNIHDKRQRQRRKWQPPFLPLRLLRLTYRVSENGRKRFKRGDLRESTERKQILTKKILGGRDGTRVGNDRFVQKSSLCP